MRDLIRAIAGARPDHTGLAYDVWAPFVPAEGDDEARGRWLHGVAKAPAPRDYGAAFNRWRDSLLGPGSAALMGRSCSRLLVGHGNASPSQVGLTLHRTWGVPIVPGSALKGLTAHYVEAVYGPDGESLEGERGPYRGAVHDDKGRLVSGPGDVYRTLFGAPPAPDDQRRGTHEARGFVEFHDALPALADGQRFLSRDVLTPHQPAYYRAAGRREAGAPEPWPNDYEDPTPVGFLSAKAGLDFLFAVTGPEGWAALALRFLKEALEDWGAGGKAAAGYGRFRFDTGQHSLEARRRELREARIAPLPPAERWSALVTMLSERQLLSLVIAASKEPLIDCLCREMERWNLLGDAGRDALRQAGLEEAMERKAFRAVLSEQGYVGKWSAGRTRSGERPGMGPDKLKARAAIVLGWPT